MEYTDEKADNMKALMEYLDSNDDFRYLRDYGFYNLYIEVGDRKYKGPIKKVDDYYVDYGDDDNDRQLVSGKSGEAYVDDFVENSFEEDFPLCSIIGEKLMSKSQIVALGRIITAHLFLTACAEKLCEFYGKPDNAIAGYRINRLHCVSYAASIEIMFDGQDGEEMRIGLILPDDMSSIASGAQPLGDMSVKMCAAASGIIEPWQPVKIVDINKKMRELVAEIGSKIA